MGADWLGALIGAGAGAVFTLVPGYVAYRRERRKVEESAILDLARDLSERRAFRISNPVLVPKAAELPDFDQLNRSVISARERIRETRAKLVRHQQAQISLTRMIQECNLYLERSATNPPQYWFLAAELRDTLHQLLMNTGLRSARDLPRPGDDAFPTSALKGPADSPA